MLKFSDSVVGSYTITATLAEKDVENIMVAAIEGGIGYWAILDNTGPCWRSRPKGEPISTWAAKLLCEGKFLRFFPAEGRDKTEWVLTLEKLIEGIKINAERRPRYADMDNFDAIDVDCIIQYALFGDVIFG